MSNGKVTWEKLPYQIAVLMWCMKIYCFYFLSICSFLFIILLVQKVVTHSSTLHHIKRNVFHNCMELYASTFLPLFLCKSVVI